MGIPVMYYKNDREIISAPFNSDSELVTAQSPGEIEAMVMAFLRGDSIFNDFLSRDVIEKYIGPIDGGNLDRNIHFIYQLVDNSSMAIDSVIASNQ